MNDVQTLELYNGRRRRVGKRKHASFFIYNLGPSPIEVNGKKLLRACVFISKGRPKVQLVDRKSHARVVVTSFKN